MRAYPLSRGRRRSRPPSCSSVRALCTVFLGRLYGAVLSGAGKGPDKDAGSDANLWAKCLPYR